MAQAIWETPIYNRTKADVDRVIYLNEKMQLDTATSDEKTEWATDLKGSFNLTDMSRIINNMTVLDSTLETHLTLPTITMLPNQTWWSLFISDVQALRDAYMTYSQTPATPTRPINTYTKVNTIEKILWDIYTILNSNFFHYSGDNFYSGESIGLLL